MKREKGKGTVISNLDKGDKEFLSQIFMKYYSHLYNYGLKIIPTHEELVKDAIQDVFYSLWDKRDDLKKIDFLKSYIFSALRLTIYRKLEKKITRKNRDQRYCDHYFSGVILDVEKIIIRYEITKEEKNKLNESLEKLSSRQKEVLYLRFYDGFSNKEVADILQVNIQTVYNYIYEALQLLKKYIG